jgi:hypothetical protein
MDLDMVARIGGWFCLANDQLKRLSREATGDGLKSGNGIVLVCGAVVSPPPPTHAKNGGNDARTFNFFCGQDFFLSRGKSARLRSTVLIGR